MSDKEKQILQRLIPSIERNVEELENLEQSNENAKEQIQEIKQKLEYLKDIAWDRQSKKESSQMFNVLKGRKEKTEVKSNAGSVIVDSDLMQKEVNKHLDNPNFRGMVKTQEMLSFPKVAKNIEPEKEARGYTWQTKANDENILIYGSRKYELNDEEVHRLATNHSKTKANERMAEEDRRGHPYHPVFNDLNFRKSANENIIPQKDDKEAQIKAIREATKKTSLKLGLGENSKNNTNIELDKSKDIDLDPKR